MSHNCAACNTKALQKCSKCRHVYYCDITCQRNHWPVHKVSCVPTTPAVNTLPTAVDTHTVPTQPIPTVPPTDSSPPPNMKALIYGKNINIAIPQSAPDYVAAGAVKNEPLIALARPEICKHAAAIDQMHRAGKRCFVNIEVIQCASAEAAPGLNAKIARSSVEDASSAPRIAALAGSKTIVGYCSNYDMTVAIPCVVWCREPSAHFTYISVQPWKVAEYLKSAE